MRTTIRRSIHTALVATLCHASAPAQTWSPLPDFPGTARDDAASFTIGTDIYVGTGMEVGWGLTRDWWRHDVTTSTWYPVAELPASPRQYGAAFEIDGKGYYFGGYDGTHFLQELWMYDPADDSWTAKASLPSTGRRACAAFSSDAFGYIATGLMTGDVPTNECWRYDPATDTWLEVAPVPGPPRQRAAAFVHTMPTVIGGSAVDDTPYADGHQYDPGTDTWTSIAPLPAPRFWHRASEGLVVGGSSSYSLEHADTWSYDPFADSWNMHPMPAFAGGPRRGGVAQRVTFFGQSRLYFGLGLGEGQRHRDWWHLDLGTSLLERHPERIGIVPNPATDRITLVQHHGHTHPLAVLIIDATGRTVRSFIYAPGHGIDIGALAPGRYQCVVDGPDGRANGAFIKLEGISK